MTDSAEPISERLAEPLTLAGSYLTNVDLAVDSAGLSINRLLSQESLTQADKEKIAEKIGEVLAKHTTQVLVSRNELCDCVSELALSLNAGETSSVGDAVARLQTLKGQAVSSSNLSI